MGRIAGVTPEETKTRLIQAAVRVFAESGYEGARVADIARDAGLSSGAIYAHYQSKAELLVDAIRAHGHDELTRLLSPVGQRISVPELLVTLGSSLQRKDKTQRSLLIEAVAASRRDPELAEVLAATIGERESLIAALLRHGQRVGDVADDVPPEVAARFCLMVVLGSMLAGILDLPPTDPTDWSRFIARLIDGLRAEEKP